MALILKDVFLIENRSFDLGPAFVLDGFMASRKMGAEPPAPGGPGSPEKEG